MNFADVEIGATYRIAGRSVGGSKGQTFLVTDIGVREWANNQRIIAGRRFIKSTQKFSGKTYALAFEQTPGACADWTKVPQPS